MYTGNLGEEPAGLAIKHAMLIRHSVTSTHPQGQLFIGKYMPHSSPF